MLFKYFEGVLNKVAQVIAFPLVVFDLISQVNILCLHQVQHWENLTVVRYQGFSDGVRAGDESLEDLEGDAHNLDVTCVQSS